MFPPTSCSSVHTVGGKWPPQNNHTFCQLYKSIVQMAALPQSQFQFPGVGNYIDFNQLSFRRGKSLTINEAPRNLLLLSPRYVEMSPENRGPMSWVVLHTAQCQRKRQQGCCYLKLFRQGQSNLSLLPTLLLTSDTADHSASSDSLLQPLI